MFWKMLRERSRVRAVKQLDIVGNLAEPGFERFVEQAADAFAAPISLLTLIHDDTLWVKAALGLDLRCVPRENGFCSYAVDLGEPLEVCDARVDPRFQNFSSVTGEPYVRYYLGAALTLMNGVDVGALCILDTRPRQPASRDQRAYLIGLARQATQALEQRAHIKSSLAA